MKQSFSQKSRLPLSVFVFHTEKSVDAFNPSMVSSRTFLSLSLSLLKSQRSSTHFPLQRLAAKVMSLALDLDLEPDLVPSPGLHQKPQ